jgi:hypothetical protein
MTDEQRPDDPDADLGGRLRRSFDATVPPPAPDTIFDAVARLSTSDAAPRSRWMPAVIVLAAAVAVVGAIAVAGSRPRPSDLASTSPAPSVASPSANVGTCDASVPILHGTWWSEIGGPNAFFEWDDGARRVEANPWLIHVRFDPDAAADETVSIRAELQGSTERETGSLNSRADPHLIYRFESQAPDLPGGWYLFEQRLPTAGCWRLSAAIDDRVVGTAVVVVGSPTGLPVDPSIEPVSLAHPSPESAEALRICQVNEGIGADQVSGMGRIDHARNAIRYVPLTGREPEIQTDAPAWIVTFTGEVPMPKSGEIWIDPTCIVVGGGGGIYATGPVENSSTHLTVTPLPAIQQPDLALPPLLP